MTRPTATTLARWLLMTAFAAALGLTTIQPASANQHGVSVSDAAWMQIQLCRNFGGHEEVEQTQTGRGFHAVWVVCRGGFLDGMDCANGPGVSDCRWPGRTQTSERAGGDAADVRGPGEVKPPAEPVATPVIVETAPDIGPADEPVVDEPVVDEPVVDEPVVDEPVVDDAAGSAIPATPTAEPTAEPAEDPSDGEVVTEPVVDGGVVIEDAVGPVEGDRPVDVEPTLDAEDLAPIEEDKV